MPKGIYKRIKPVWNKGKKMGPNPEHSKRMLGRTPWNKGLKEWTIGTTAGFQKGHSFFTGGEKGWFLKGTISKTAWKLGDPRISGENQWNWKGGVTPKNHRIRSSTLYQKWRKTVFERDNYTCQWCRKRGGELNADHIKPFAYFPELRLDTANGRTLCLKCHKKTPNYMNRWIKAEQFS